MRERGTGVSSLPLNTECQLLGIKYRPEYPAIHTREENVEKHALIIF